MMNIIKKTSGTKIDYQVTETSIVFGNEDLIINLKNREMDEPNTIDVCADVNGFLVVGAATGMKYVAQVKIPGRTYVATECVDSDGNTSTIQEPVPFSINNCTLTLWGMEG